MSHAARQGNKELLDQFVNDKMDELLDMKAVQKLDEFNNIVHSGRLNIDKVIECFDEEIRNYYAEQWRPNR